MAMLRPEFIDRLIENTWRDAERTFHHCLLHFAEQLKDNTEMSASDGLREMAKMFEQAEQEVRVFYNKRNLN